MLKHVHKKIYAPLPFPFPPPTPHFWSAKEESVALIPVHDCLQMLGCYLSEGFYDYGTLGLILAAKAQHIQ